MVRKIMVAALACTAIALPAAAPAGPGNAKAVKAAKTPKAERVAAKSADRRAQARSKSQGPANASPRALERASPRSVLGQSGVVSGPLAGLDPGDDIYAKRDGSLVRIGSVTKIVASPGGGVGHVLVRRADRHVVPVPARSLAFDPASGHWVRGSAPRSR